MADLISPTAHAHGVASALAQGRDVLDLIDYPVPVVCMEEAFTLERNGQSSQPLLREHWAGCYRNMQE